MRTLSEVINRYLEVLEAVGRSESTISNNKEILGSFRKSIPDDLNITEAQILNHLQDMRSRGNSPGYIWLSYSTLKGFFNWMVKAEILEKNPMEAIPRPSRKSRIKQPLTDNEIARVVWYFRTRGGEENWGDIDKHFEWVRRKNGNAWRHMRNYILCNTMMMTGLRCHEALSLKWENVDLDEGVFTIKITKTHPRRLAIVDQHRDLLRRWKEVLKAEPEHYLFPSNPSAPDIPYRVKSFRLALNQASKKVGVNMSTHDFRRTLATRMIENEVPLPLVQQQLGHTNMHSTLKYLNPSIHKVKDSLSRTLIETFKGDLIGRDFV